NGQSPYSSSQASASLTLTGVNAAPVLTAGTSTALTAINEDNVNNAGQTVASFRGTINDVDGGALKGIAITGQTTGNGHWEYKLGGSSPWLPSGTIDSSNVLLLRGQDSVRSVPKGENGTAASLNYLAWDQTNGAAAGSKIAMPATGGTTAFSTAS